MTGLIFKVNGVTLLIQQGRRTGIWEHRMLKPWNKMVAKMDDLDLPPVTQIGMVVPDRLKGVHFYREFFNIPKWYHTVTTGGSYHYRNRPGEAGFGFHHFGVVVNNQEKAKGIMKDRGFAPLQEGTLKYASGGKTKVAYLDTMEKAGLILDLIETKQGLQPASFGSCIVYPTGGLQG
jgi:hypothetical protein